MEKWIDGLLVDVFPPEEPKFKAPLVLVHGLWSGSRCWRQWATHLSNLGWECWAVNFRGRFEEQPLAWLERLTVEDCLADLQRIIRSVPAPPVLLAHSFGGLLALKAAEDTKVAALVLLCGLPPSGVGVGLTRLLRLLRLKYLPLIFLRRPFRLKEKDFCRSLLACVPEVQQADILSGLVPESGYLIGEFFHRRIEVEPTRIHCPTLVVGGAEDPVVPIAATREMAQRLGAEIKEYSRRGHWIIGAAGGEVMAREIHRWLVHRLGEGILLAELFEGT